MIAPPFPDASNARRAARHSVHVWLPSLGGGDKGGIQTFSESLVSALIEHLGGSRLLILAKNDRQRPVSLGADCQVLGRVPEGLLRTALYLGALLLAALRRRPSLIIVGHANFSPVAAFLHRWFKIRFWVVTYGLEVWGANGARVAPALRKADELFAISPFTRDQLLQEQGLDADHIRLLPVTFDPVRFHPAAKSAAMLAELGLDERKKIILTVCRLAEAERYKGYDQIIRAMPAILRAVPDAHYVLGGHGKDAARVRKLIAELGLAGHITLAGFIPDDKICALYNLCDVFAMPSKLEGFGIVFLEALACGKPVVAGNQDGAVEALCHGELGILVNPDSTQDLADSLIAILTKTHPHPLIYQPEELRRRVIDAYGPQHFSDTVGRYVRLLYSKDLEPLRG